MQSEVMSVTLVRLHTQVGVCLQQVDVCLHTQVGFRLHTSVWRRASTSFNQPVYRWVCVSNRWILLFFLNYLTGKEGRSEAHKPSAGSRARGPEILV